jgi:hypothetical protein
MIDSSFRLHEKDCDCDICQPKTRRSAHVQESPSVSNSFFPSITNSLESLPIDQTLSRKVKTLTTALIGISSSVYNSPTHLTGETARMLASFLYPCRGIHPQIREVYEALYFSVGSLREGGGRRRLPVPLPPTESAPLLIEPVIFRPSCPSRVLRTADSWAATVVGKQPELVARYLAIYVMEISERRIDVYPMDGEAATTMLLRVEVFGSDDPSAKSASDCLREVCSWLSSPDMRALPLASLVNTETWKFEGIAEEYRELYCRLLDGAQFRRAKAVDLTDQL